MRNNKQTMKGSQMKIKRTAKFHKKLTLKQVAHCKELNINPNNIVRGLIHQKKQDLREDRQDCMRWWCWVCSEIASRLGLNDKLNKALDELSKEVA